MAQMWAGHCGALMGAATHLKDEAVSHRLRQAESPATADFPASLINSDGLCLLNSYAEVEQEISKIFTA